MDECPFEDRIETLENNMNELFEKVDRIDENLENLSNGGLANKLQEQNEKLVDDLVKIIELDRQSRQKVDLKELDNKKYITNNKFKFKNKEILYGFIGGIVVKFIDLITELLGLGG